jgi:hypothetical protein
MSASKVNVALYGRNGVGKTTLACQGEGPIALIGIDPSPTAGARSVSRADVTVYTVASHPLPRPDGALETVYGSEKVLAVVDAVRRHALAGQCPFRRVVIDGLTSWNDVILAEVLGVPWDQVPGILGIGKVSADQYTERSERMIRYLKPVLALPCDVWLLAQEKDHNPPKEDTTTRSGKRYSRPVQTRLMQEVHPAAQEGSFWSLAVGDAAALHVQNACDFVLQLYEDNEWEEQRLPDVVVDGRVVPGATQSVPTGRRVKRLRCTYHANYAARVRGDYRAVPEYIEAPTPEERHAALLEVAAGRRTKYGHYPRG